MIKKISILLLLTFSALLSEHDALQILNKHWNIMRKDERKEKIKSLKFNKKFSSHNQRKYVDNLKIWRKGDSLFRLDRLEENAVNKFNEKVKETFFYNYGEVYFKDYKTKYTNYSEGTSNYDLMHLLVFEYDNFEYSTLVDYDFEKYPLMFDSIVNINNRNYYKLFQLTDSIDYENNFYFDVETKLFYFLEAKFKGNPVYKREIASYIIIDGFYFPKIVRTYFQGTLQFEWVYDNIKINPKIDDRFFHPEPE